MPRGMVMVLTLIVLASALYAGWWSNRRTEYFPPRLIDRMPECVVHGVRRPAMDPAEADWFAGALADFREPSLYRRQTSGPNTLRLTWLRSFHYDVVVRIEGEPTGIRRIVAKRNGSSEVRELERPLSRAEADRLDDLITQTGFYALPPSGCAVFPDGAQWILEGVDPTLGYVYRQRQSPKEGPERALGLYLLGLTGWDLEPVY